MRFDSSLVSARRVSAREEARGKRGREGKGESQQQEDFAKKTTTSSDPACSSGRFFRRAQGLL